MNRVFITTNKLAPTRFYRTSSPDKDGSRYASIAVGIPGFCKDIVFFRRRRPKGGSIENEFPDVQCRVLGQPVAYLAAKAPIPSLRLEEVLLSAVVPKFSDTLDKCLEEKPKGSINLHSWHPEEWDGKFLVIPIDFIKISNFDIPVNNRDVVTASIQLGHHLVVWNNIIIRDDRLVLEKSPINHKGIKRIIRSLLKEASAEVISRNVYNGKYFLSAKTSDCAEDAPYPIYFSERLS